MAAPHEPDDSESAEPADAPRVPDNADEADEADGTGGAGGADEADDSDHQARPTLVVRIRVWDVVCTCALLTMLVLLATVTTWPSRLFGFARDACPDGSCGLVPFGVDQYIFPVMWGGIGAAVAAAALGPIVSLLRGWYMFFWPIMAALILMLSSLAGYALTTFSEHYWH